MIKARLPRPLGLAMTMIRSIGPEIATALGLAMTRLLTV